MLTAFLQFGSAGNPPMITRRADSVVEDAEAPRNPYRLGYGRKIPTQYRILFRGRWRRVYAMQYANAATLWATVDGAEILLQIERS